MIFKDVVNYLAFAYESWEALKTLKPFKWCLQVAQADSQGQPEKIYFHACNPPRLLPETLYKTPDNLITTYHFGGDLGDVVNYLTFWFVWVLRKDEDKAKSMEHGAWSIDGSFSVRSR